MSGRFFSAISISTALLLLVVNVAVSAEPGQRWAVLVGVNDYAELGDLQYCRKDAQALAEQLMQAGFPEENVFLVTDGAGNAKDLPTKSNIETRIRAEIIKIPVELPKDITNSIGMKLKLIPAGEFMMGSPEEDEKDHYGDEGPQHRVRITRPFYLGAYEVTQGEWEKVMGSRPWSGKTYVKEGSGYAASYVSWDDAVEFCKRLSEKEGRTYRLPTEAQWEYACRAGSRTTYSFGNDSSHLSSYAWFRDNAYDVDEKYAHRVGQKRANSWGLYDMHGNVWEWCQDWSSGDYYKKSPTVDPTGPATGSDRVIRGGSWHFVPWGCRSAARARFTPDYRSDLLGFRIAIVRSE